MLTNTTARHLAIFSLFATVLIVCWPPVRTVLGLGLHDDRYVQTIAAPFLFSLLMYWERNRIFPMAAWSVSIGLPLLSLALAMYFVFLRRESYGEGDPYLMLTVLAVILVWIAMFILCFGVRSFRAALFPFLCLLLMIPVPVLVMDKFTAGLQHASAATSYEILRLIRVPVLAQGMTLSLPGLEIEVAPECSGVRSCLALALVGLLAARVFLRCGWNRVALVVATIPIAILKNAIRISVIAWLGAYVNRAFLFGRLHRNSGLVFNPLAVALLVALLIVLQKSEAWVGKRRQMASIVAEGTPARTV